MVPDLARRGGLSWFVRLGAPATAAGGCIKDGRSEGESADEGEEADAVGDEMQREAQARERSRPPHTSSLS